jgi:CAAX prenyl protease-like protein
VSALKTVALETRIPDLRKATLGFTALFAVYIAAMATERLTGLSPAIIHPIRLCMVAAAILIFSRPYLDLRPGFPMRSTLIGLAVFVLWIAPDLLFHYRHFALFENPLTGRATSSIPVWLRTNLPFMAVRVASGSLAVPILEELFWRGWLMRWLVDKNFIEVSFGLYAPSAFWLVAILFASEHGPYWEVGLAAGVIYNWWIIRTKNLADCILAHAVTNACLAAYVLATGLWGYWL